MNLEIEPLETRTHPYPWESPEWVDRVASNPAAFASTLTELGIVLPALDKGYHEAMGELVRRFPMDFAPAPDHGPPSPQARAAWGGGIRAFFTGVRHVEEETAILPKEFPLCMFNSPKVENAKTTYELEKAASGSIGWKMEVLGSGAGSDVTVAISQSGAFPSSNGDRKIIFAPMNVKVSRIAVYKSDKLQGRILRAELWETDKRDADGLRIATREEWDRFAGSGPVVERFPLAGDTSKDVTKYTRSYEIAGTIEATLGVKALSLESKITTKLSSKRKASMTFELPAGRLYELRKPATSIAGFYFAD